MNKNRKLHWSRILASATGLLALLLFCHSCAPSKEDSGESSGASKGSTGKGKTVGASKAYTTNPDQSQDPKNAGHMILGGGCFWCVEEVLHQLDGVTSVVSGYAGGKAETANYEAVCRGATDHAEVVKVTFDRDKIGYEEVLDMFWKLHDPTTVNRQGHDVGRQYRSVIFYQNEEEKKIAEASKKKLNEAEVYPSAAVTLIVPLEKFYVAEKYHQNYARLNPDDPYIRQVLYPKLKKLKLELPKSPVPQE